MDLHVMDRNNTGQLPYLRYHMLKQFDGQFHTDLKFCYLPMSVVPVDQRNCVHRLIFPGLLRMGQLHGYMT